jgi:hypothetical protein
MLIKEKIIDFISKREKEQNFHNRYPCYHVGDIKCPNFEICENYDFPLNMSCHGGLCMTCDVKYGTWDGGKGVLQFKDDIECPICLENKRCVTLPKCNHYICIDDFKRSFYGDQTLDQNEPKFPYPELEDDYFLKNQGHPSYENDPDIIKYHEQWNHWDNLNDIKRESENYLLKCPICRS